MRTHENTSLGNHAFHRIRRCWIAKLSYYGKLCSSRGVSIVCSCSSASNCMVTHGWLHWRTLTELQLVDCSSTVECWQCWHRRRPIHWRRLLTGGSFKKVLVFTRPSHQVRRPWPKTPRGKTLSRNLTALINGALIYLVIVIDCNKTLHIKHGKNS